jgi:hypothetical protein
MGFYSNNKQKQDAIWEQLNLLQTVIEDIHGIVTDHGYSELESHMDKLHNIYGQLHVCNEQPVWQIGSIEIKNGQ